MNWLRLFKTVLICIIVSLDACDRSRNNPGYTYFPDMAYSRAYETYTENPNFEDSQTLRIPVEGTIPREIIPFPYEKTDEDLIKSGKELINPLEINEDNTGRGRIIYEKYCLQCHGISGDGNGYLYSSGRYPYPPASLINDKLQNKPDGEIYHQISLGWGIMGAHGLLLRPQDRWKVIVYIRKELQHKD